MIKHLIFITVVIFLFSVSLKGEELIKNSFIDRVSDVCAAEIYRYQLRDDDGRSMDCLEIFQINPTKYIGLYHNFHDSVFSIHLAKSTDLLNWKHVVRLDQHASQGSIWRTENGSFLIAYEKEAPNSCWIRLRFYENLAKLIEGVFQNEFDVDRSLAPTAEGTPSFESVNLQNGNLDQSEIDLRFHYFKRANVDRLARGKLTNFSSWIAHRSHEIDAELIRQSANGNFGDRSRFEWDDQIFYFQEVQFRWRDWSSWRIFLCSADGMPITRLRIRTHSNSVAFCNPNVTVIRSAIGEKKLAITLFLPFEGNSPKEFGELIYVVDPSGSN